MSSMAALAVAGLLFLAPAPVSAQTCPYNSTQTGGPSQCTCPTSGPGVTCVGGQLYSSNTSSCYNDPRPCASNQVLNCASGQCACNTSLYPCGGCTAPTSTPGGSCSSPVGGQYTNQCGACGCPSGTQLCSASNTCVAVIACPAGTTFDPCTASCGTPNVLLSPSWDQAGNIRITGNITSTAGDIYMANGKAIRVDGTGVTTLNIGNWGTGGTEADLKVFGEIFGSGISTFPGDDDVSPNTIETSTLCLGDGTSCRTTWPSSSDFNPTYVNASGADSMSGPLTINGAGTNLTLAGAAGAAGTPKMQITAPSGMQGLRIVSASNESAFVVRNSANTTNIFEVDETGTLIAGAVPWARLTSFPSACAAGQFVTGVGGTLTCAAGGVTGSGTSNYVTKFATAGTVGNSQIYDNGTNVGIGTTTPAQKLDVVGTVRATSFVTSAGATLEPVPTGTSGQTLRHSGTAWTADSNLFNNGTNVGIGTATPAQKLDVSGTVRATGLQLPTGAAAGRVLSSDASGNASWTVPATYVGGSGTTNYVPKFTAGTTLGNSQVFDNGSRVGIGTAAPDTTHRLDVTSTGVSTLINRQVGVTNATQWVGTLRLTSTGAVADGFGPTLTFSVAGSGVGPNNIASITAVRSGSDTQGDLRFSTSGSPRLTLGATGNVGVGTTNPAYGLDVSGDLRASGKIGAGGLTPDSSYGIRAQAPAVGGYFAASGYSGQTYAGYYDYGMLGYGNYAAGYFYELDTGAETRLGYAGYGLYTNTPIYTSSNATVNGTLTVGYNLNSTGDSIRMHTDRAEDGSYEWLGFYSGAARQGIIIYDGSWDGCSSTTDFCIKAEDGNDLQLKADGAVRVLSTMSTSSNLSVGGSITSNYWSSWWTASAWNGGSTSASAMESAGNYICPLVKMNNTGNGGECRGYISGSTWYRYAVSASGTSRVDCEWYCFKYK